MKQLPQERTNQVNLFPGPVDGAVWELNPLGFIWLPLSEATRYELRVRDGAGSLALQQSLDRHYFAPTAPLEPGQYEWSVEAWDAKGISMGERPWWKFTVLDDAPRAVCPSAKSVLENLGEGKHPTLVFMADELEEVRRRIREEHADDLATLKATARQAMTLGLPLAPTFHLAPAEQQKKMYYARYFGQLRPFVDMGLVSCSLYYLLTGDKEAGARARELMLHICGMTPEGPNAVDGRWGDEPGLSYTRCLHGCYDWTYDLYDEREREFIEHMLVIYCRQTYRRLINQRFMMCTGSSHMGRLPGYLGEQVILLHHRLPEAVEILQYVLDVFNTFYPHFGGVDGGWGQGVNYGAAYNRWYIPFFTTFYKLTGFSFWQRPFYRKVKDFFLYCCPSNAEYLPFGDGEEHGLTESPARSALLRPLFQFYARWFSDPDMRAVVERLPAPETFRTHIIEAFISPPEKKTAETAPPAPEGALANSRIFRGIGWAALHSDLEHPERDNFLLFKSSPFGSYSHSHADQNSFFISAGGKALAIPAGYYGPGWDAPHHHSYTRQTLSHNCILVDGEGESGIDCLATGKLVHFEDHPGWSYVCGNATEAYKGRLRRFLRHVLFIRPATFIIYDDLEADHPVKYSWLLHSLEAPKIDTESAQIDIAHNGAFLHTELAASRPLVIDYTDQFATPYNEGLMEEFHRERPNQHHVSAHTEKCQQATIAAVLTVWQGKEQPHVKVVREADVLKVTGDDFSATMSLAAGAPSFIASIEAVEHNLLAWQSQPRSQSAQQP